MEILRRGTPKPERQFKTECRSCTSIIQFVQAEGKVTYDQRGGDFITVNCPVCDNPIHVNL